jgi:hypothetical protein
MKLSRADEEKIGLKFAPYKTCQICMTSLEAERENQLSGKVYKVTLCCNPKVTKPSIDCPFFVDATKVPDVH